MGDIDRAVATATLEELDEAALASTRGGAFDAPPRHGYAGTIDVTNVHRIAPMPKAAMPSSAATASSPAWDQPLRLFHGHYHRLAFLGSLEASVAVAAFYVAVLLRFGSVQLEVLGDSFGLLWPRALLCAALVPACLASMGLYDLHHRLGFNGVVARIAIAIGMAQVALVLLFYAMPAFFIGRGVMMFTMAITFVSLVAIRYAYLKLVDEDVFKRRIAVWGAGEHAASIGTRLRRRADQRGFKVVGYLAAEGEAMVVRGARYLDNRADLFAFLAANRVEEIVVAMDDRRRGFPEAFLRDCRMRGIMVQDIVAFLEDESGHVNVDLARPSWLIFSEGFRCDLLRTTGKRAFDMVVALALLVLTLPVTLATALAIWLEDRGPVLYRQPRVGQQGRVFPMLKFRSMRTDAEAKGAVWAMRNDPRVTRVGAFIRRARIDEIPQAVNVLLGEMSFVGPRPERPEFVERLSRTIPFYAERHFVKPGITGWAQVKFPYGASDAEAREKLGFDLYYVKNHNLVFDLVVLLRTVEVVLFRMGSR